MITTYPNQKRILIKRNKIDSRKTFLTIQGENLEAAMNRLNGTALKLYLYLAMNRDGYELAFSPQYFADKFNTSLNSARDAVQILIKEGFLTMRKGNSYDFNEIGNSTSAVKLPSKKELYARFEDDAGKEVYYTKENLAAEYDTETAEELWNQSTMKFGFFEKKNNQYIKIEGGNE